MHCTRVVDMAPKPKEKKSEVAAPKDVCFSKKNYFIFFYKVASYIDGFRCHSMFPLQDSCNCFSSIPVHLWLIIQHDISYNDLLKRWISVQNFSVNLIEFCYETRWFCNIQASFQLLFKKGSTVIDFNSNRNVLGQSC